MDKQELAKRLMATFLEELHEHVGVLNDNLLALEKQPPPGERAELLQSVFRAAHSLKGAARAVSVTPLETVCHHMEDYLSEVRAGKRDISPSMFSLLFKTVDAIEEAGMRLRDEQTLDDSPLHSLAPEFEEATAGVEPAEPEKPKAEPEPPQEEELQKPQKSTTATKKRPTKSRAKQTKPKSRPKPKPKPAEADAEKTPAAAEKKEPAAPRPSLPAAAASVRVNAEKLDSLVAHAGELLVARRRVEARPSHAQAIGGRITELRNRWREVERPLRQLSEHDHSARGLAELPRKVISTLQRTGDALKDLERDIESLTTRMRNDARMLSQTCETLDDEIHYVRMLPFAEACGGLARAVRDIAKNVDKKVRLEVKGEDVEVDRSVLEGLKDPILHLVRNAVDHGIEAPEKRASLGKPETATVTVSAELRGGQVEVVVADDGAGINLERIREKLQKLGWTDPQDDRQLVHMLFQPGFSTAPIVTDVSGRGVGLDVVQSRIEALHGSVDVSFKPNEGTQFILTVPLTLTTIHCVQVKASGHVFAIPTVSVVQLVRFSRDKLATVGGRDALLSDSAPIPLALLTVALGLKTSPRPADNSKSLAIVLAAAGQEVGLIVDEFVAEQEVLVKNLGARVRRVPHVSGATLLPSGQIALVLNAGNVIRSALGIAPGLAMAPAKDQKVTLASKRLLVVEDSLTTRTLMKSILETEGFEVTVAPDGQQAWEMMSDQKFDLVVSDVDMPRMDGFALTEAIRRSDSHADLPVILVTARETDEDKKRGIKVGANAYLVKSTFDQRNLLETIDQLL